MIGGMLSNKKLNPIVTELFNRGGNLNIYETFKQTRVINLYEKFLKKIHLIIQQILILKTL